MDRVRFSKRSFISILRSIVLVFIVLAALSTSAYASSGVLDEAKQIIKVYYVDEVPDSVLDSANTVQELVDSLGDPHSAYFSASEYQDFVNSINNKFSGIGIYMDTAPEGIKVTSVIEGSPAYKAGLLEGDIITEADGFSLQGITTDEASMHIKGDSDTSVHLKVLRNGTVSSYDIVREEISQPTVTGKMLGNLAYIDISSFGVETPGEFGSKLEELNKNNPSGYIIDLRNNPGGYVSTALDLAGYFAPGQPALITSDKSGVDYTYFSSAEHEEIDKPVAFLINGYSASASEILSSFVKDYKKAFMIGTKSYGKGTMQSMFTLSDGSVLKITVDEFFSPLRNNIDKVGIVPDLDTADTDALSAAELLLDGSTNSTDKTGYIKVGISGRDFEIDLKKARLPEYWSSYSKIISKAEESEDIYIGTESGWASISDDFPDDPWMAYYPGYIQTTSLSGIPTDKKFTIAFSKDVDASSIKDTDIELLNTADGERVGLSFENINSNTVRAIPKTTLKTGSSYLLVINNSLKGAGGDNLKNGTFTYITAQ